MVDAQVRIYSFRTPTEKVVKILHIQLAAPLQPNELEELIRRVSEVKGELVRADVAALSGRLPIWAYAALVHALVHSVPSLGTLDPKLRGIVIVASHTPKIAVGEVISVPEDLLQRLLQLR